MVTAEQKLAVGVREAAAMLSISRRQVQNYITVNVIPVHKVGRRTLILVRDLEAFLREDRPSPMKIATAVEVGAATV